MGIPVQLTYTGSALVLAAIAAVFDLRDARIPNRGPVASGSGRR